MPAQPRNEIVDPLIVGVYHCWSRCVRRAFLCGQDPLTGKDYEHRRQWICDFERQLASLFGIEVGFHAEMSNHLHLVLRNRPDIVETWSDEEVVRRWLTITKLVKSLDGLPKEISWGEIAIEMANPDRVAEIRVKLSHPSAFMGSLCEHIGRRCNRADRVTGKFWEDRYKCSRLENEASILVCGIYVDLNQIRAGEAETPEESRHTSAYDRIVARQARQQAGDDVPDHPLADDWLCELTLAREATVDARDGACSSTPRRASDKGLLSVTLDEYLQLLDATGRIVKSGKSGAIPAELTPILERLRIKTSLWTDAVTHFQQWFGSVVGTGIEVACHAAATGRRWLGGAKHCRAVFG